MYLLAFIFGSFKAYYYLNLDEKEAKESEEK